MRAYDLFVERSSAQPVGGRATRLPLDRKAMGERNQLYLFYPIAHWQWIKQQDFYPLYPS